MEEFESHLVADYPEAPARLRPLLALWDTSAHWLMWRLQDIGDQEWGWDPGPRSWAVREVDGRWRRDSGQDADPDATVRTIAWTAGHLGELGLLRADWTTGTRSLEPTREWPGTAKEGMTYLGDGVNAWRATLGQLTDDDLDTVGRSAFPWGLDPELPLLDIVWWNTRELIHHASDIGTVRDLYRSRH